MRLLYATTFSALVLVGVVPSASVAQDPARADLRLTQTPTGAPTTLTIGEERVLRYDVRNNGPSAVDAKLQVVRPVSGFAVYDAVRPRWWMHSDGARCEDRLDQAAGLPGTHTMTCVASLEPDKSFWLQVALGTYAPGTPTVEAAIEGSQPDPDGANNRSTWTATVLCSINGTDQDDLLVGTPGPDSICAGEGDDRLVSVGGGPDDEGQDRLFGQGGDDVFEGGRTGHAVAMGGSGFDTVTFSSANRPVLICRSNDRYSWASGWQPNSIVDVEEFVGSPYGDTLEGTTRADRLYGGGGNDRIIGLGGRDVLYGGRGADRFITTDARRDVVRGGRGTDRARVDGRDQVVSSRRVASAPFSNPCDL